jgi:hypothetical protein
MLSIRLIASADAVLEAVDFTGLAWYRSGILRTLLIAFISTGRCSTTAGRISIDGSSLLVEGAEEACFPASDPPSSCSIIVEVDYLDSAS